MTSIDLAVVLVSLVAGQVPGQPPEPPGELAAKQSAARTLSEDLVARYLVFYDHLAATAPPQGEGEANERAQEGLSLLIQEFLQPRMQQVQREAMAGQVDQQIKELEARGEKPPANLVAQREALKKPPVGGGPSLGAFEKKYGKDPTKILVRNQQKLFAGYQAVVARAMGAAVR
jgi:hypothetical protein